jgi:hypothetical protein
MPMVSRVNVRFTPKVDICRRSDFMSFQTSIISFVLPPCQ